MLNNKKELIEKIKSLPTEGQEELFRIAAFYKGHEQQLEIILEAAKIKPRALTSAFYEAATHNYKNKAKLLVKNPEVDINWINNNNYGLTPAIRAADNGHGDIVNMIIDREDFNPNVVIKSSHYLGIEFNNTVVTKTFGFVSKEQIKKPNEKWKRRLLKDKRIDWELHNKLIEQRTSVQPLIEAESIRIDESCKKREALERKVLPVRKALGLPDSDYGW